MDRTQSAPHDNTPVRVIKSIESFTLVAGSMVGIGIFLAPPLVAQHVSSPGLFIVIWLLGGLTALSGAVVCAELGALIPKGGGDYVIQHEAFGPSIAFATGWALFSAIFAGSIATMAVGLSTFQLPTLLGYDPSTALFTIPGLQSTTLAQGVAVIIVFILTAANVAGAKFGARVQAALTYVPIVAFAGISIYALTVGPESPPSAEISSHPLTLEGIVVAYMAVYFAYSGWINIIYVAGEVERPNFNIPMSLIGGTVAITALYVLLCGGFLHVLGMNGLATAGEAGSAMVGVLWGDMGTLLFTAMVALALTASVNATVMGGARVLYAMAKRGAAWSAAGDLDGNRVPAKGLWLQAGWVLLLLISGRFEDLYTMVSLTMVVTGSLTVGSIYVLRRRQPDVPRPYSALGYPWFPAVYLVTSFIVAAVMIGRAFSGEKGSIYPLLGVGILMSCFVLHRVFGRKDA